ncbi:site-specific integrase [Burkholderia ubonensis]|uniref:site-specific integrase n=1 Tax=Burkholderia ubonensis TaxID=101571 RepID=UPI000AE52523|nr:site-specific integrase [Burkholderia ubonensis]
MSSHLLKVGTRYYFRRRVPQDLVAHLQKTVVKIALGTSDRTIALSLCRAHDAAYDVIFADHRVALANKTYPKYWDALPLEQLEAEEEQDRDAWFFEHEEAAFARLRQFLDAEISSTRTRLGIASVRASVASPAQPLPAPPSARNWDELLSVWRKDRNPQPATWDAVNRSVERFIKFGGDPDPVGVTKAAIAEFKDAMDGAGHSPGTVRETVVHLSALFAVAVSRAWRNDNPCTGMTTRKAKKTTGKPPRVPFDAATMNRIFGSTAYVAGRVDGDNIGARAYSATYWLPLLGLFTGARIEELAQLSPDDVCQESYHAADGSVKRCWVVRFIDNEEAGQKVKNESSIRRIPLHRELLERGFIEFAQSRTGQRRIFCNLTPNKYGVESYAWSVWWHRQIRKECSPTSDKMVFHSFRHTFKHVCRSLKIEKEVRDAIQGHTEGGAAADYGDEFYPLRPLVEAMDRYHVPGVKLPGPFTA